MITPAVNCNVVDELGRQISYLHYIKVPTDLTPAVKGYLKTEKMTLKSFSLFIYLIQTKVVYVAALNTNGISVELIRTGRHSVRDSSVVRV